MVQRLLLHCCNLGHTLLYLCTGMVSFVTKMYWQHKRGTNWPNTLLKLFMLAFLSLSPVCILWGNTFPGNCFVYGQSGKWYFMTNLYNLTVCISPDIIITKKILILIGCKMWINF